MRKKLKQKRYFMLRSIAFSMFAFDLAVSALPAPSACADKTARFETRQGEISDKRTGLIWRRCSEGMTWTGATCVGRKSLFTYKEALKAANAAGPYWRVPTAKELSSLIDLGCGKPAIDTALFPDVSADDEGISAYWTSSASPVPDLFYYIEFMEGFGDAHSAGFALGLRLVRNAMP